MLAGGAYAWVYFQNSPGQVLGKMQTRIAKITSGKFSADLKLDLPYNDFFMGRNLESSDASSTPAVPVMLRLRLSGAFDRGKNEDLKIDSSLSGKISGLSQDPFDLALQLKILGHKTYLKLDQLPPTEQLDLSPLTAVWLVLDTPQNPDGSSAPQSLGTSTPSGLSEVSKFYSDLQKIYFQSLTITKNFGTENLNGTPAFHYQISVNPQTLASRIKAYQNESDNSLMSAYIQTLKGNLESMKNLSGEIWVGKKDFLPYRLSLTAPSPSADGGKTEFTLELSNHNQPVEITAPQDARDFMQTLQQVIDQGQSLLDAPMPGISE